MFTIPTSVFGLMALIITTLAGVVVYLYKDNKNLAIARLNDLKEYNEKTGSLAEGFRQQQELWFDKLQLAREKR